MRSAPTPVERGKNRAMTCSIKKGKKHPQGEEKKGKRANFSSNMSIKNEKGGKDHSSLAEKGVDT